MANQGEELAKVIVDSKLNIEIGDCWEITADSLNYILRRKSGKRFIIDGYYSSLDSLIEALLEKKIRESEIKNLMSVKRELKNIRKEIKEMCSEINAYVKNN